MLQENPFQNQSSAQLVSVFNQAPVTVIVSSTENRGLFYVNDVAYRLFTQEEYQPGMTCHEAASYEKPCPFCQCDGLSHTESLVQNRLDNIRYRTYQLEGKLIDWGGEPACIEYIMDVTDTQVREEQVRVQPEEMERTFRSPPCGLCVCQYTGSVVSPVFHNLVFYEAMGYSNE